MGAFEGIIWRCPVCETINRSEKCAVCGEEYRVISARNKTESVSEKSDKVRENNKIAETPRYNNEIEAVSDDEHISGYLEGSVKSEPLYEHKDISKTEVKSSSPDLHDISKSYRMRSLEDIEGKKEDLSEVNSKLREISKSYRMRSLEDMEV